MVLFRFNCLAVHITLSGVAAFFSQVPPREVCNHLMTNCWLVVSNSSPAFQFSALAFSLILFDFSCRTAVCPLSFYHSYWIMVEQRHFQLFLVWWQQHAMLPYDRLP